MGRRKNPSYLSRDALAAGIAAILTAMAGSLAFADTDATWVSQPPAPASDTAGAPSREVQALISLTPATLVKKHKALRAHGPAGGAADSNSPATTSSAATVNATPNAGTAPLAPNAGQGTESTTGSNKPHADEATAGAPRLTAEASAQDYNSTSASRANENDPQYKTAGKYTHEALESFAVRSNVDHEISSRSLGDKYSAGGPAPPAPPPMPPSTDLTRVLKDPKLAQAMSDTLSILKSGKPTTAPTGHSTLVARAPASLGVAPGLETPSSWRSHVIPAAGNKPAVLLNFTSSERQQHSNAAEAHPTAKDSRRR